jgi:fibronectin-binding autotransporter adhesin
MVALLLAAQPVFAATYTWNTSATTGTWDDTNAWISGTVPTSSDTAYFGNTTATSGTLAQDSVLGVTFDSTADLTLSSGTLTIGSGGISKTNTAGTVTISSATLLSASQTWANVATTGTALIVSGSIGATSGAVTLSSSGAGTTAVSGVVGNGSGVISITNSAGTLILSGSNTYSGGTTLTGGTIVISGSGSSTYGALGTGTVNLNGGTIYVTGSTTSNAVTLYNTILETGSSAITLATSGSLGTTYSMVLSGSLIVNGTLSINLNTTPSDFGDKGGALYITGNIAGSGLITETVGGSAYNRLFISGTNSAFTGTMSLGNGSSGNTRIRFNSADSGFANGVLINNANTTDGIGFNFTSGTISFGNILGNGVFSNDGGAITLQVGTLNQSGTFSGTFTGSNFNLLKSGSGAWVLSGNSTATGTTTIAGGTLQIGVGSTSGSISSSSIIDNASLVYNRSDAITGTATISGTGNVIQAGSGMLTLSGSNTYSGGTIMKSGTLKLGNSSALGTGTLTVGNSGVNTTVDLNGQNLANVLATNGNGGIFLNSSTVTTSTVSTGFNAAGASSYGISDFTITGAGNIVWTGAINRTLYTGNVNKTGSGTVTFSGTSVIAGEGLVLSGGVVIMSKTATSFSTVTISSGTLKMDPNNQVSSANAWAGAFANSVTMTGGVWDLNDTGTNGVNNRVKYVTGTAGTITNSGTAASLLVESARDGYNWGFGGNLLDGTNGGTVALSIVNSGYLGSGLIFQLSGSNSYSGATSITDNTLQAGSTTAFSKNSAYTLTNSVAKLDLNGYDNSIGSLAGTSGTVYLGSGNITYTSGTNSLVAGGASGNLTVGYNNLSTSFGGTITGGGSLTKTGTGTLAIGGTNTYTGATTISGGELDVNGSLAASSTVGVNVGTVLGGSGTINGAVNVASATIKGSSLKIQGATTFTGASTLAGVTTLNGGGTVSSDTLTVTGTTTGNIAVSAGATVAGSGLISGVATVSGGAISGSGLRVDSASFSGVSTLSGTTTFNNSAVVTSGSLKVLSGANISGALTVNSGATLLGAGSSTLTSALTVDGGTLSLASGDTATNVISSDSVSLADNSTFQVRLGVDTTTSADLLTITGGGTISLGDNVTLVLSLGDALASSSLTSGTWEIIQTLDGSYRTGTFANSTGTVSGYSYTISYDGGDVYVTLEAVPEPSTWAMIVGGIGMLAFGRRFRRWSE